MRELLKRDWQTLSGVVLISIVIAGMGWGRDDQAMVQQSRINWVEEVDTPLQLVTFEQESKTPEPIQTAVFHENAQLGEVVLQEDLKRSEYCNGRCEQGDQILQMALKDPVNQLPLDSENGLVSAKQHKGRFARVQFYMHERYSLPWRNGQLQIMCQWASQSPVDGWELARNKQLAAAGGVPNPFVDMPRQLALRCQGDNV